MTHIELLLPSNCISSLKKYGYTYFYGMQMYHAYLWLIVMEKGKHLNI